MKIPFTPKEFMQVIVTYNQAVWPMQLVLIAGALLVISLMWKTDTLRSRLVSGILGGYWLWMGIAYHWVHFTTINKAAWVFGGLFIIQGMLFLYDAVIAQQLLFNVKDARFYMLAWVFLAYALLIYPVLGTFMGHPYPQLPTFGLPCPTTIFTFGVLLTAIRRVPVRLIVVPVIWSLIGFSAAINFDIYEDIGLLVAGIIGTIGILLTNRKLNST